ncbi:MAG: 3-oxo-5a-steroid 4- dehydrogenase [Phylliscum demangeonii]|nr:MAG: 3-oxo-5a-steroid 4- dehydrogenase [Phylliscum demangeonii]
MEKHDKTITLQIQPKGKPIPRLPATVTIRAAASPREVYERIAAQTGLSIDRLRIHKGSDGSVLSSSAATVVVAASSSASSSGLASASLASAGSRPGERATVMITDTITDTGLRDGSVIRVKDLGPQIGWRTVFMLEYLGPLLIHPLVYYYYRYSEASARRGGGGHGLADDGAAAALASTRQRVVLGMVMAHFLKRELETVFVHRFSAATMPVRNVFKNCAHYWLLAGLNIAYFTYRSPSPSRPSSFAASSTGPLSHLLSSTLFLGVTIVLFAAAELLNLGTHLALRALRRPGSTERGIPRAPHAPFLAFELVTCPNYLWETVAWVAVWAASGFGASVALFLGVAVAQMALWARKKERRYRVEFGNRGYRPKRWALLPGVV